ncbi:MAG: mercury methylation corrinoid protein HgcA [Bacteroidetes bacterium]|nr:mercury methylation corrinoid protein HgcA [Bacteroidota bacterium]
MEKGFIVGQTITSSGTFPVVSTLWSNHDRWNTIKVRWSIGRMRYTVEPGIYGVGTPDENSRVFVTANFKLSFDHLRRALNGINAWILVLNTRGINVWCAAGKGTFGTKELVKRIRAHKLENVVSHRKLIVPQFGAVGVAAHEVKKLTGFSVIYGPVLARDIKPFLDAGMKATQEMRRVEFPLKERMKLIPVEIMNGGYWALLVPLAFFIISGLQSMDYSIGRAVSKGSIAVINLFAAYLSGCALTPILLPWIPFRRFALKGLVTGLGISAILFFTGFLGCTVPENISWLLMLAAISSFMAMNFTGTSTFTSLSGVQKEMKLALPLQIIAAGLGLIGWIVTRFI